MSKSLLDDAIDALKLLVDTIEATGGVEDADGFIVPVADPDWIDLGDAYIKAKGVLLRAGSKTSLTQ